MHMSLPCARIQETQWEPWSWEWSIRGAGPHRRNDPQMAFHDRKIVTSSVEACKYNPCSGHVKFVAALLILGASTSHSRGCPGSFPSTFVTPFLSFYAVFPYLVLPNRIQSEPVPWRALAHNQRGPMGGSRHLRHLCWAKALYTLLDTGLRRR